jgi:AsmA protein
MKGLRIVFSLLALVVVIVAIAAICLTIFIDPNKLKPVLAEEVMKQTGYQLVIDGNLTWSFYPTVGVKAERMQLLTNNEKIPFVDLRNISIAMELSQLLRGNKKLQGDVHIGEVILMNIHAAKAHIGLHWQNNVLTMQPITANLYDGSVEGVAEGSKFSSMPAWNWSLQFSDVQLKKLLLDINGSTKLSVSGLGNIKLSAATKGKTKDQLLGNLNGASEFIIKNGSLEGIDLNYLLHSADALMNKKTVDMPPSGNQTNFDGFSGVLLIKDGVASTQNLLLSAPAFTTKGIATINIVNENIDSRLQVTPQQNARTQWEIPVLVTGSLSRPEVRLDTDALSMLVAKDQLEQLKANVRDKIKQNVPGKTGEYLQNLLGS